MAKETFLSCSYFGDYYNIKFTLKKKDWKCKYLPQKEIHIIDQELFYLPAFWHTFAIEHVI